MSVRKPGAALGTRREIKNLNSFKFMQQAIDYEVRWQIEQLEDGHAIHQATVLFNPDSGETRAMRSKEDAADYRYFPDPDLPPLVIEPQWIERVRTGMTELPRVMAQRFVADYELSEYDATALTQSRAMAAYFEATTKACAQPKLVGNWIMGEVSRRLNISELGIGQSPVTALQLAALIERIHDNTISNNAAKLVFERLWTMPDSPVQPIGEPGGFASALELIGKVIAQDGLAQLNDLSELEKIVDDVLAANAKNVEQYKAGNGKALNALVGQIMKGSNGKANPQQVNDLLRKKLA